MNKALASAQEIGTICYVGGILSHIVIGAVAGGPGRQCCLLRFTLQRNERVHSYTAGSRAKNIFRFGAFLSLRPKTELAEESMMQGRELSQSSLDKAQAEQLVGMTNAIPLVIELLLGSFKPRIGRSENSEPLISDSPR